MTHNNCPSCMRLEQQNVRLRKQLQSANDKAKQSPVQQLKNIRAEIQELRAIVEKQK